MDLLQIIEVSKSYKGVCAIKDININIPEGSLFGLLGRNGAGKTTLLRIINQLILPDKGTILYNNEPITRTVTSSFGFLPEERGLYSKMKVSDQIVYFGQLKGLDKTKAIENMNWWFNRMDVDNWQNKKVEELSKGMSQKIQFIVAMINFPKFLILDEPFTGLDPVTTESLKEIILELNSQGSTIILSTHNLHIAEELCDSIAIINDKKVAVQGELNALYSKFDKNTYTINIKEGTSFSVRENDDFEVISNEHNIVTISIKNHSDPSQVIREICNQVSMVGLKKQRMTLNKIFLNATGASIE